MNDWVKYEAGDRESYVTLDKWGKDHWSAFAYADCRATDNKGVLRNEHMRCNSRLHRVFAHSQNPAKYPTRLKEGTLNRHDDWSCLEDAVAMGLIEMWWKSHPMKLFGGAKAKVEFTPEGQRIAGELRAHKANGGTFATFAVSEDIRWQEKMDEFLRILG
jgi:hypothetical protein